MPLINFTAGSVPTESDLDTVSRQSVIAGNSAPSGPSEGMVWYDTNAAHPLVYVYDGSSWWPIPMGLVAKGTVSNTGTGYLIGATYATINGSDLTFSAEADNRYRYSIDFHLACNEVDDLFSVQLQTYDGSSWTDSEDAFIFQTPVASQNVRVSLQSVESPSSSTYGFRTRVKLYYGTGSGQINGGTDCMVEHIGSATLV